MEGRRCRRRRRLRWRWLGWRWLGWRWLGWRRKLERFFPVEVSAFRTCSENESQRQSEQPFHFCLPSEPAGILPQHALDEGGKRNALEMRVTELLISD